LPFSHISKLFSKITGQAKVAPGAAAAIDNVDDVVGVGAKFGGFLIKLKYTQASGDKRTYYNQR